MSTKDAEKKSALVILPKYTIGTKLHDDIQLLFNECLNPLLTDLNYSVFGGDDITLAKPNSNHLSQHILSDDIVIASLTQLNPNIYSKLIIRRKFADRITILLSDNNYSSAEPIDTSIYKVIKFDYSKGGLKKLRNDLLFVLSEENSFAAEYTENFLELTAELKEENEIDILDPEQKISKAIIDSYYDLDPNKIIRKAEQAVSKKDLNLFLDHLQSFITLDSFIPTDKQYLQLYFLAKEINEKSIIAKAILDIGLRLYPESEILFLLERHMPFRIKC